VIKRAWIAPDGGGCYHIPDYGECLETIIRDIFGSSERLPRNYKNFARLPRRKVIVDEACRLAMLMLTLGNHPKVSTLLLRSCNDRVSPHSPPLTTGLILPRFAGLQVSPEPGAE
jgi:hypothetical protein